MILSECIMDIIETNGEIDESFTGIPNADGCNDKCNQNSNCSVWSFKDGVCFMKNEKTFLIRTTSHRLVSGMKDCDGSGIIFHQLMQMRIHIYSSFNYRILHEYICML